MRFEAPGFSYDAGRLGLRGHDSGRFWHEETGGGGGGGPDRRRQLLFSTEKKGSLGGWRAPRSREWRDREGRLLAVEGRGGGRLELMGGLLAGGEAGGEARRQVLREALLACWVGNAMASGSLKWDQP